LKIELQLFFGNGKNVLLYLITLKYVKHFK